MGIENGRVRALSRVGSRATGVGQRAGSKDAGMPPVFSPHSFRVLLVADLLCQEAQYLDGHANPRTTQIYDRRRRRVTRNSVALNS